MNAGSLVMEFPHHTTDLATQGMDFFKRLARSGKKGRGKTYGILGSSPGLGSSLVYFTQCIRGERLRGTNKILHKENQ